MDITELRRQRATLAAARKAITSRCENEGRDHLTTDEDLAFRQYSEGIENLDQRISDIERSGRLNPVAVAARRAQARINPAGAAGGDDWSRRAADAITRVGGEARAVTSASIDIPRLVEPSVIEMARPTRLLDLIVDRKPVDGNAFEYYRQNVRTNGAKPVADSTTKPTSTFTITPVEDRCRVVAHLSEPVPVRLLQDHDELVRWLDAEMRQGVLDAIEAQMVAGTTVGAGNAENFTGITNTVGTTAVPFDTDVVTTLRSAVTALQVKGENPTAWVLHPADAQAVDLLRYESTGAGTDPEPQGFLTDGYAERNASSANIFGPATRLVSTSVPVGTALLADWNQLRLYVREDARVDIDASGPDLFDKNLVKMRGEARVGIAVLRPQAFAIVDLTA